jgi:hypothetical protein
MNAITPVNKMEADVPMAALGGGGMMQPRNLRDVMEFSQLMCKAGEMLPKHLREKPGACAAITMQALRWEMDPFAVGNKSYFVNDRVAYEAQLIAAVVNTRAGLKKRLSYSFDGEGQALRCTVIGEFQDGTAQSYTSPRLGDIAVKNSPLWKTDPQQQLAYYSARSWARRYVPEVILGVYDRDEIEAVKVAPMKNVTPINPLLPPVDPKADESPLPFLERFADALALATTVEEVAMVQQNYDDELLDQDDATKEAVRLALNAKELELRNAA